MTDSTSPHAPVDPSETPHQALRSRGRRFLLFAYLVPPIPIAFSNIAAAISMRRRTVYTGPTLQDELALFGTLGILVLCLLLCVWGSWYFRRSILFSFLAVFMLIAELAAVVIAIRWISDVIMGIGF